MPAAALPGTGSRLRHPRGRARPRRIASDRELRPAARGRVSRTDHRQGVGRHRRQLSRPHDRLRGAGPGLPVHRAGVQHARLRRHAGAAEPEVSDAAKQLIADLVVRQRRLIGGNFSEPGTTSLIGERPLSARARRVDGGYSITGRKMFASMLEAADHVMVMAYPDDATSPFAGMLLLVPHDAAGRASMPTGTRWACARPAATR